jgi:hypothetical protein
MPNDELDYPEIVEIARQDAERKGMAVEGAEKDESLFVTIRRAKSSADDPQVTEVTFWTSGTGAFLVDFDNRWSWQLFAYDRADQIDAIHDLMKVADYYLRGAGEEQAIKVLRPKKEVMVMTVDGE